MNDVFQQLVKLHIEIPIDTLDPSMDYVVAIKHALDNMIRERGWKLIEVIESTIVL